MFLKNFAFVIITLLISNSWASQHVNDQLSFEQIQKILENKKIKTVEDFLGKLDPSTFRYYSLMRESRSIQKATAKFPRVIVFSSHSETIFTYGHFDHRIEFIRYDPKEAKFTLREAVFSKEGGKLSAPNPKRCLGCHGSDPRPIWEPYPFWKGAFAEDRTLRFETAPHILEELNQFYGTRKQHARYRFLPFQKTDSLFFKNPYEEKLSTENTSLTVRTIGANLARIARLVRNTPQYRYYKYAILSSLMCDPRSLSFESNTFKSIFESRGISTSSWPTIIHLLGSEHESSFVLNSESATPLIIAYHLIKSDPDLQAFKTQVDYHVSATIPEYKLPHYQNLNTTQCGKIQKLSSTALQALLKKGNSSTVFVSDKRLRSIPVILSSCASCHSNTKESSVPFFPFHEAYSLKNEFKNNQGFLNLIKNNIHRMPPSEPLNRQESQMFLDFLVDLSK